MNNFGRSFWSALAWLRALARNLYFWGGMLGLFGLGLAVYLLVDAVVMPSYTRHDVSTPVPNVETLPFQEAKDRLQHRDLKVQRQVGRYNPNVDTGIVVDQTPLPTAKVKPGRRVYLTVNAGEVPMVRMPDLRGMSVREAKNRASSVGLVVGSVQEDPVPSPYANTITKQEPSPGDSLEEGKAVALWYSTGLGDQRVGVPNVVGLSVEEAERLLLRRKLRSVLVDTSTSRPEEEAADTSAGPRYVRRQAHAPGDTVRTGTEIRLYTTSDAEQAARRRDQLMQADSTADGPSN
jgi:beta-lactam-binding protein with PASTA domain